MDTRSLLRHVPVRAMVGPMDGIDSAFDGLVWLVYMGYAVVLAIVVGIPAIVVVLVRASRRRSREVRELRAALQSRNE